MVCPGLNLNPVTYFVVRRVYSTIEETYSNYGFLKSLICYYSYWTNKDSALLPQAAPSLLSLCRIFQLRKHRTSFTVVSPYVPVWSSSRNHWPNTVCCHLIYTQTLRTPSLKPLSLSFLGTVGDFPPRIWIGLGGTLYRIHWGQP